MRQITHYPFKPARKPQGIIVKTCAFVNSSLPSAKLSLAVKNCIGPTKHVDEAVHLSTIQ
ncbi:uncharacterized protein MELLADRAFT_51535 [Melampsora larici-populina 98AG31]|uniref:Uncharacterized protein n=1 Tax=Melampsora larici-populina (strain 98AG31 / pathotype 3-4-7) TaxID=747676 RepID=F4R5Z5_MELLP|nr:uncharacterized protein MELLADRAFT_51535 [Melampsora larici-populina 98AG31]EGG12127.1 hypothetical protein MELLADRAFT_51535 [Melampsora larici-populina 98AG31]